MEREELEMSKDNNRYDDLRRRLKLLISKQSKRIEEDEDEEEEPPARKRSKQIKEDEDEDEEEEPPAWLQMDASEEAKAKLAFLVSWKLVVIKDNEDLRRRLKLLSKRSKRIKEDEDEEEEPPACSSLEQIKEKEFYDSFWLKIDASRGLNGEVSFPWALDRDFLDKYRADTVISFEPRFAEIALKFYEKRMHEKFEVVQVLFSSRAMIAVPGFGLDRLWCHVSFTAIPKNTERVDVSEKHFFGEMVFNLAKDVYDVIFCSTFNPSDPGLHGCVFCPSSETFFHPAHGCPAGGREIIGKSTGAIQMDVSQGQIVGCSEFHPPRSSVLIDDDKEIKKYFERVKSKNQGYAEIALKTYKENMGVEFEIVEVLYAQNKAVVASKSNRVEEWCHVCFTAKPRKADSSCVSPDYFLGELLRDDTTKKYKGMYCNMFKPADDYPARLLEELKHHSCSNMCEYGISGSYCLICEPCRIHPSRGFHVYRGPYLPLEFPHLVTDGKTFERY